MEAEELDNALKELETRLERLRALYEQYFLGIEKLEPTVARKDVDRRFWALRKVRIRNTAKRFKLQTIIQRYNTFAQHWARICREIENGTYKRQLLRAERRMGDVQQPAATSAEEQQGSAGRSAAAVEAAQEDLAAMLDAGVDPLAEAKRAMDEALGRSAEATITSSNASQASSPSARPRQDIGGPLELDDLDLGFGDAPKQAPAPTAPAPDPPVITPSAAPRAVARVGLKRAVVGGGGVHEETVPRRPTPLPHSRTSQRPLVPPASSRPGPPTNPPRPAAGARPAPQANTPAPARSKPPPLPARKKPPLPSRRPAPRAKVPQPQPPQPQPKAPQPTPARPPSGSDAASRPKIRSAVAASGSAASIFGAKKPTAAKKTPASLSDDRVNALHKKLVAAKKQLGQESKVSVDGLRKQLSASRAKLQTKHKGRNIDFDVVVKNGKAVVKPKIS